jgi:transposase
MGDSYLRKLLVVGATSVIRRVRTGASLASADWVRTLLERRPARVVTVAMADKTARIVWAVMTRGESYRPQAVA